ARSRAHAGELIDAGRVSVRGSVARKAATAVEPGAAVHLAEDTAEQNWASRGAHKLLGALEMFVPLGLGVSGRRCLDAGASTGGFTDVLLRHGAASVVAADVGRGLLVWRLQTDERVILKDRTNVRYLAPTEIGGGVDLIVADLSFISLPLVLPALRSCMNQGADLVPMIKPQFEVGKAMVGSGGVVRDPHVRAQAVHEVIDSAAGLGLAPVAVLASPLPGPAGNVEFFAWLREGPPLRQDLIREMVATAIAKGPQ
ncbi:MAG: TlyA family RNA methyltransferase, partial [Sciscionella sp.]